MKLDGISEIASNPNLTPEQRLQAFQVYSQIESLQNQKEESIKSAASANRIELLKALFNPTLAVALISIVTLIITNSFTESQSRTANDAQIALEKLKFQFDIMKSALSEKKDEADRAKALQFLTDVGMLSGLEVGALADWADGKKGGVPTFAAESVVYAPSMSDLDRRSVDPTKIASLVDQAVAAGTNKWMSAAIGEIGVAENTSYQSNPRILNYAEEAGIAYSDDSIAWSGLFVAWVLKRAGYPITDDPLMNYSWKTWGNNAASPVFGALVVAQRPPAGSGNTRVGFYVGEEQGKVRMLSGNIGNAVDIMLIDPKTVITYRLPPDYVPPNL